MILHFRAELNNDDPNLEEGWNSHNSLMIHHQSTYSGGKLYKHNFTQTSLKVPSMGKYEREYLGPQEYLKTIWAGSLLCFKQTSQAMPSGVYIFSGGIKAQIREGLLLYYMKL